MAAMVIYLHDTPQTTKYDASSLQNALSISVAEFSQYAIEQSRAAVF